MSQTKEEKDNISEDKPPKKKYSFFMFFAGVIPFAGTLITLAGLILKQLNIKCSSAVIFTGLLLALLPWVIIAFLIPIKRKRSKKNAENAQQKLFNDYFMNTDADISFFKNPALMLWNRTFKISVYFDEGDDEVLTYITPEQKDAYLDFTHRLTEIQKNIECAFEKYFSEKHNISNSSIADNVSFSCIEFYRSGEFALIGADTIENLSVAAVISPEIKLLPEEEWFNIIEEYGTYRSYEAITAAKK